MAKQKAPVALTDLEKFPEHSRLILYILSRWNSIEFLAVQVLAGLMKTNQLNVGRVVYATKSSRGRLNAIETGMLGLAGDTTFEAEIKDAIGQARACLSLRNDYAHCSYLSSADDKKLHRWDWGDKGYVEVHDVRLATLKQHARQITKTYDQFENLLGRIATKENPLELQFKPRPQNPRRRVPAGR